MGNTSKSKASSRCYWSNWLIIRLINQIQPKNRQKEEAFESDSLLSTLLAQSSASENAFVLPFSHFIFNFSKWIGAKHWIWDCPPLLCWQHAGVSPHVCVKPHDSCYASMIWQCSKMLSQYQHQNMLINTSHIAFSVSWNQKTTKFTHTHTHMRLLGTLDWDNTENCCIYFKRTSLRCPTLKARRVHVPIRYTTHLHRHKPLSDLN